MQKEEGEGRAEEKKEKGPKKATTKQQLLNARNDKKHGAIVYKWYT